MSVNQIQRTDETYKGMCEGLLICKTVFSIREGTKTTQVFLVWNLVSWLVGCHEGVEEILGIHRPDPQHVVSHVLGLGKSDGFRVWRLSGEERAGYSLLLRCAF